MSGDTSTLTPVRPKSGHVNVQPASPDAVNVVLSPLQIFRLPFIMGVVTDKTFTVCDAVLVQPLSSTMVTVYSRETVGVSMSVAPGVPSSHVNVPVPMAVSVTDVPAHTSPGPLIETVGMALTVTLCCTVCSQPASLVNVS